MNLILCKHMKKACFEYEDEKYTKNIKKCSELLTRVTVTSRESDLSDIRICLQELIPLDYFKHMYRNNKIIKELTLRLMLALFKSTVGVKEVSIFLLEKLLDLDYNKSSRSYANSNDEKSYQDLLMNILPQINQLISNVNATDKQEFLNTLTNIVIYLFETLSIDKLKDSGTIRSVLEDYIQKCTHQNLCAKVLAGMSINFFESVDKNDVIKEITIESYNAENDYLVYIYSKFSEKLLDLMRTQDNTNFRKDVTYGLLNITYYANKKMKLQSELCEKNETRLKSKMKTINKVAVKFLEEEVTKPNKRDLFMIRFFYSIIIEHLKMFNGYDMDEHISDLMGILTRVITLCGTIFPVSLRNNTYAVIEALVEKCHEKMNLAFIQEFELFWFYSLKRMETSAYAIVAKLYSCSSNMQGLYPYSKKIINMIEQCFEENTKTKNFKLLTYQTDAILCLLKYYSDRMMFIEFREDNFCELLKKYNLFMKCSLNECCKFSYYIDFYLKLFTCIKSFNHDINIWKYHIDDIFIFFQAVTDGNINLGSNANPKFYLICESLIQVLHINFKDHMQQYTKMAIDFCVSLKANICKEEEKLENSIDFF